MRIKFNFTVLCLAFFITLSAQNEQVVIMNNYDEPKEKAEQVKEAYLGVTYNNVTEKKAKLLNFPTTKGAYITNITQGSAAEKVGLQAFDYLVRVGDMRFTDELSFSVAMDKMQPNQATEIEVIRKGKPMVMNVVLTARPEKIKNLYDGNYAFLGVTPSHDKLPEGVNGTRVNEITVASTAEAMGMKSKDIVLSINDNPTLDWHDMTTALQNTPVGNPLKVVYYREADGQTYTKTAQSVKHGDTPVFEGAEVPSEPVAVVENTAIETENPIIEMQDVTQAEADDMLEDLNIEMPIENDLSIADLRLFPNPNNGIFNLNFNLQGEGDVNIVIYSADGKVVYQDVVSDFTGEYLEQINISDNAKGIYFLMVRQGKETLSKKIVLR